MSSHAITVGPDLPLTLMGLIQTVAARTEKAKALADAMRATIGQVGRMAA